MRKRALPLLLTVLLASCASTKFHSTWKAPDAGVLEVKGRKIAAIFVSEDESIRRAAEDTLAGELVERGADGVASYTIVTKDELQNRQGALEHLKAQGFAGAIVMRITGREQQISSMPSTYAGARYSNWGWRTVYEPEVRTDTIVSVETLIYSLLRDKLLWAGTSETFNPARLETFVSNLADAVADEMHREGLLP